METFWLCFVPLFVAVDAVGLLPMFLSLTEGLEAADRRRVVVESIVTALLVAIGFLFLGQWLFRMLGITEADFMIAGGGMLFALAMGDLFMATKGQLRADSRDVGAVPIGVPLTVGPAVLATILLLANQYGRMPTVLSIVANILLAGLLFSLADKIYRLLGRNGARTISKITTLILAAIAVKMIREGLMIVLAQP